MDYGANNSQAWRNYIQRFTYDGVGNILAMQHIALGSSSNSWTRQYQYATDSNRLLSSGMGAEPANRYATSPTLDYRYPYDVHGSMTSLPHLPTMDWDSTEHLHHISRAPASQGTDPDGCIDSSVEVEASAHPYKGMMLYDVERVYENGMHEPQDTKDPGWPRYTMQEGSWFLTGQWEELSRLRSQLYSDAPKATPSIDERLRTDSLLNFDKSPKPAIPPSASHDSEWSRLDARLAGKLDAIWSRMSEKKSGLDLPLVDLGISGLVPLQGKTKSDVPLGVGPGSPDKEVGVLNEPAFGGRGLGLQYNTDVGLFKLEGALGISPHTALNRYFESGMNTSAGNLSILNPQPSIRARFLIRF